MLQDGRDEQKPQVPTISPVLEGDQVSSDPECYDFGHVHLLLDLTHYLHMLIPMTHSDSHSMTHRLLIVPYDIITDVTMTHADS